MSRGRDAIARGTEEDIATWEQEVHESTIDGTWQGLELEAKVFKLNFARRTKLTGALSAIYATSLCA